MSNQEETTRRDDEEIDRDQPVAEDIDVLRTQLELVREENRRLRQEYTRAKQAQHRHTAIGFAIVGIVALLGAALFPGERTVLLALGATGLFGAVLTYFLTPERFVAASVGEQIYGALSENHARIAAVLGLQDDRIYVPFKHNGRPSARLFVPQHREYTIPDPGSISNPLVVPEDPQSRGLSLLPTGSPLFEEVTDIITGELAEQPEILADQIADAIVESFELAETITVERTGDQIVAGVTGSVYGDVERFDHPIPSLFGTALSVQLETPVSVTTQPADDQRADVRITCRWDGDESAELDAQ